MMTTNLEDIATEDLAIAKSSVAISSAHRGCDGGDDGIGFPYQALAILAYYF